MKTVALALAAATCLAPFSGCTFPSRGVMAKPSTVGRAMKIENGEVISVSDVVVKGESSIIGTTGGGLIGRAVVPGSRSTGGAIASAGAVVAGSVVGSAVEEAATRQNAQEVTLRMDSGQEIVVIQVVERRSGPFAVGERIQVLDGNGSTVLRRPSSDFQASR